MINSNLFSVKGTEYEVFFGKDGHVEICEIDNPGKTGFIFEDIKNFNSFINSITDIAEKNNEGVV